MEEVESGREVVGRGGFYIEKWKYLGLVPRVVEFSELVVDESE